MQRTATDLQRAIELLEAQRPRLGDALADAALAGLRSELQALTAPAQAEGPAVLAPAAPQGQDAPLAAERPLRLVSVLFLDVVGSTALSQQMDAEDTCALMDGALAAFTEVVDRHGGQVLQYAGDSLLAGFGLEEVHEDDAERAVLAGLALLQEAEAQAALLRAQHPGLPAFAVRVGVHSGSVLLGDGVDGHGSIRGATVNLAARMEQSAPAGGLRISQDTWRLVRGLFEVQAQPPLQVKGHDEALRTWLVTGLLDQPLSAARRGVDGVHAPLLGRQEDLAWLEAACSPAGAADTSGPTATHHPGSGLRRVLLLGEGGLGKTRLLHELLARRAQSAPARAAWVARAAERLRNRPYGLLREALLTLLGLQAQGGAAAVSPQTWQRAVAPWLPAAKAAAGAELLGHLLALPGLEAAGPAVPRADPRALRDEGFELVAQMLHALAAQHGPLLLALDDVQWGDDGSLDFLEHLVGSQARLPLCLLLLARPALLDRRPGWAGPGAAVRLLSPLPAEACLGLAQALLRRVDSGENAAALALTVAAASEGNPFFMEERVNMLIDTGVIAVEGERWALHAAGLEPLALPTTLQGLLQARLDALPATRRRALQAAAIVGATFWDQPLAVLDASAPAALGDLERRDLVTPQPHSRLPAAREYSFRHHSVHKVAYDSVLRRVKQGAHRTLAAWLARQAGAEALVDQLAEHLERAGQAQAACAAWHQAAQRAQQRFANADALAHVARALALLDTTAPEQRAQHLALTLLRLEVLESLSDREGMAQALQVLSRLATEQGDPAWQAEALLRRSRHEFHFGDAQAALALAQQAVQQAPAERSDISARAWNEAMHVLCRLTRFEEATAAAAQALQLARAAGHRATEASTLNQLGMMAFDRGDIDAASAHYEAALALHRAVGHVSNEGGTLCNLAYAALAVADYENAQALFEQSAALCDRVGQRQNRAIIDINLGIVALQQEQPQLAAQHAERALSTLRTLGDRWAEAAALRVAGQAALQLGQAQQARQWCQQSCALFDALQMENLALEAMAVLAEEALARQDSAAALAQAEAMLARLARGVGIEGTDEPLRIPWALWRALQANADPRAAGVLAQARSELLARARRLLNPVQRQNFLQRVPCHRDLLAASGGLPDEVNASTPAAAVSSY